MVDKVGVQEQWLARGMSQPVYALAYPEARDVIRAKLLDVDSMMDRHERPWERRQDAMHDGFKTAWVDFAARARVEVPKELARNFYPCAGASEAIRETLAVMGSKGSGLAVFEGEYEGFEAIAAGLGMRIERVARARWREELPGLWAKGYELFVSNPSSIDGNYWNGFNECCRVAEERGGRVHADVSYLGACARSEPMDMGRESVRTVIFSLSKVFGVYYRRIGGCFAREPNPLLHGNMWFKSLDALAVGVELLDKFAPGELPRLWGKSRERVLGEMSKQAGWEVSGADVFMLASGDGERFGELGRAPGFAPRVCVTPALARAMEAGHG